MKILIHILAHFLLITTGLTTAYGFTLPKLLPDKGATYSFGNKYDYDNAGSKWNHGRVYRHPGHRHHYNRWYYNYGHKRHYSKKYRYYPYEKYHSYPHKKYGYNPDLRYRSKEHIYRRHPGAPKGYSQRKHIQLRDRIPSHSFKHTRSYNRVRIGR